MSQQQQRAAGLVEATSPVTGADKVRYLQTLLTLCSAKAAARDSATSMLQVWADRGYGAAGANPIMDADLASAGFPYLTAADVVNAIAALQQAEVFYGNRQPTAGPYGQYLNKVRNDK